MEMMEIVLLIAGGIIFILSFFIPDKKNVSGKQDGGAGSVVLAEGELKGLISQEIDAIRTHVDEVVEEAVTYAMEKTERSLERLSNEKIMAVSEYSDTVLGEIHKNHEEAMFLYDMLNNKHVSLKNTVAEVNRTVKEAEAAVVSFQKLAPETLSASEGRILNREAETAARREPGGGMQGNPSTGLYGVNGASRTGIERAGNERAGNDRTGIERTGNERTGIERIGNDRAGNDRAAIERTGNERTGIERAGIERAATERAGIERSGIDRTGNERTGIERTGIERAATERAGIERSGIESIGIESIGIERTGIERTGIERTGTERTAIERTVSQGYESENSVMERLGAERLGAEGFEMQGLGVKQFETDRAFTDNSGTEKSGLERLGAFSGPGRGDVSQDAGEHGRNNNERILELFQQDYSMVDIARELGLGVGEVKLVIDLFKRQ